MTGKSNLTYWEAVESERKEAQALHRRFPDALKERVLRSVQFVVTGRLDNLVETVFERFKDRFWPGEPVLVEVQGDRYQAKVKDVFPSRALIRRYQERIANGQTESEMVAAALAAAAAKKLKGKGKEPAGTNDHDSPKKLLPAIDTKEISHRIGTDLNIDDKAVKELDNPNEYLYTVQLLDEEGKYNGSLMEVKGRVISRDRLAFSKTILRKYIRTCVVRDASIGAPWVVKHVIAHRYGIPINPSDEIRAKNSDIKEAKLARKRKIRPEEEAEGVSSPSTSAAAKGKTVKRKKKTSQHLTPEEIEAEEAAAWAQAEEERRAEKRKTVKFPWDDLDLGPITARELASRTIDEDIPRRVDRPKPSKTYDVVERLTRDQFECLLGAYHFLISCGKVLKLANFPLDDFEAALRHDTFEPVPTLISEIHAALINVVLADVVPDSSRGNQRTASASNPTVTERRATRAVSGASTAAAAATVRADSEEVDELQSDSEDEGQEDPDAGPQLEEEPRPSSGEVVEGEEEEKAKPDAAVKSQAREISQGWDQTLLTGKHRVGWDRALVGLLLERGSRHRSHRWIAILSQLTGIEHPDALLDPSHSAEQEEVEALNKVNGGKAFVADTYSSPLQRYFTLPIEDKITIINMLAEQAALSKSIRRCYEECEVQLTEYRKERAELTKQKKKL